MEPSPPAPIPPAPLLPHWAVEHGRLIWYSAIPGVDRVRWPAVIVHIPHGDIAEAKEQLCDLVGRARQWEAARAALLAGDDVALERALEVPVLTDEEVIEAAKRWRDQHRSIDVTGPGDLEPRRLPAAPDLAAQLGDLLDGFDRHPYEQAAWPPAGCRRCGASPAAPQHDVEQR